MKVTNNELRIEIKNLNNHNEELKNELKMIHDE